MREHLPPRLRLTVTAPGPIELAELLECHLPCRQIPCQRDQAVDIPRLQARR